jgi:hypothetical protein
VQKKNCTYGLEGENSGQAAYSIAGENMSSSTSLFSSLTESVMESLSADRSWPKSKIKRGF